MILAILATLARQEKVRISERVKAGLEKAKTKGRTGGRPKLSAEVINRIKELKGLGFSNRRISRELNISNTSVGEYLASN